MNRSANTLLDINPNVIQDMPLPDIVHFLIFVSASLLIVLDLVSENLDVAVTDSGITTAQIAPVDFMPDIFDTNDEDLPVEYLDWEAQRYGQDDLYVAPDTVEIRDTLRDTPGPIDNLATVIERQYHHIIEIFNHFRSVIETAIGEFRFRSPMLNIEDFDSIRAISDRLLNINERIREIGRILNPMSSLIEIGSRFWVNHPALHASFERVHSNSGLLLNATGELFRSVTHGIDFLSNLINELHSRHNDKERNL